MAGGVITRDLAHVLETPLGEAESLKKRHGCAVADLVDEPRLIEVSGIGGEATARCRPATWPRSSSPASRRSSSRSCDSIIRSGYGELLTSGVVLTGGTVDDAGHR